MTLPPKPDEQTGEPRPPQAPIAVDWKRREITDRAAHDVPAAPNGHGPALEWHRDPGGSFWVTALLVAGGLVVVFSVVTWGFEWVTTWWLWLFFLTGPLLGIRVARSCWYSAGADWYQQGDNFVSTYYLGSVHLRAGLIDNLELKDRNGNEVNAQLDDIQRNQALWDLVYNGILHSVRNGGAETNDRARLLLELGDTHSDPYA